MLDDGAVKVARVSQLNIGGPELGIYIIDFIQTC